MDKKKVFSTLSDFFEDDKFIAWRLLRTEEYDDYWNDFVKENPQCLQLFQEAVEKFDSVQLNNDFLPEKINIILYDKI